jgi:putative ABC transport system substrate-binding protein
MQRREFITLLGGSAVAWPLAARAQRPEKIPSVGILWQNPLAPTVQLVDAFRQGLRELGYVEGQNITIELRSAEGRVERLPALAAELVRLNVDVIMTATTPSIRAAQQATKTIPIVMGNSQDPVSEGFVASLARPRGNITGQSLQSPDLAAKRLQLLKEVVPTVSRIAVLWNSGDPALALSFKETAAAAQTLHVQLQSLRVRGHEEFKTAFRAAVQDGAEALVVLEDALTYPHRTEIAELAKSNRLPAMYGLREFAEAGGLMAYGPNLVAIYRQAATYVDKILKGARPADLPVEQPTRFELVINLKTAKALGLTIPPSLIAVADQVIE